MEKSETLFYHIMNYPIPKNWEYFSTEPKKNKNEFFLGFSRETPDPLLQEYREYIQQHKNIFRSLPRIKKIYLCNSLSFNKLNKESDIDLFIVTKKNSIRRARLISLLIFFILGLKRNKTNKKKKYCLSFYITEEHQNLYNISLPKTDIYLIYRIAHLIPLYEETKEKDTIYNHNNRIYSILPNLPKEHNISIDIPLYRGNTKFKIYIQKLLGGIIGRIVEFLIKIIRIPILIYKTKKLKNIGKDIIFNDYMLKFFKDERSKIALRYKPNTKEEAIKNNR